MNIIDIHLPDPPNTRKCMNEDDWGDKETIGKHLKRRKGFSDLKENDFGVFLGEKEGKIIVGIKNWDGGIVTIEEFDSIDEAKKEWILD